MRKGQSSSFVGQLAAVVIALGWSLGCAAGPVPSFETVRAAHRPSDLLVLDRHGAPLQTLRVDPNARRAPWLALDEFSPALREAVLLSEDQRFTEHGGIDWSGLARSTVANATASAKGSGARQGASTVTMQLAGLIDPQQTRPREGRSVTGKFGQMWAAQQIEANWRKPQILEAYLNRVPLRGELVGVPAAAQALFGKHASGLDRQESALLAALIRGPNAAPKVVAQRACGVLKAQQLSCLGMDGLAAQTLPTRRATANATATAGTATGSGTVATAASAAQGPTAADTSASTSSQTQPVARQATTRSGRNPASADEAAAQTAWAPHHARALLKALPAARERSEPLRSTLDGALQRLATRALRQQLGELSGRHVEDGAVLVLDNATGEVRAWVGSSGGTLSDAPEVDAVLARRQPGSTLKPFVYGLALERRLITPASLLEDAPTALPAGGGLYLPQNYDRRHHGWVTARTALASSLNIPAVKLGVMLSPDALFDRFNALGLRIRHSGGWHGYALALGSAEVSLLDLTNAYRALANAGRWSPVRLLPAGSEAIAFRAVADPAATWLVSDILADNTARALTFGLDSALVQRGWAAVKTGTSKDLRDNWCIGYNGRYTVGVWVGNASGAPMHQVSGTSGAAPVWHAVMAALLAQEPGGAPASPAGIESAAVNEASGRARTEHFLAGTAPLARTAAALQPATLTVQARGIRSPTEGSIFTLDPDMPPRVQRLVFEGESGTWSLDGRTLGRGSSLTWAPWPGRHVLRLTTASGRVEERRFEVRGAVVKSAAMPRR